ncbi:MAG: 50S ribosomal protein L29 [Gammaproteobacteria bacterium]|nr:50S ribosomal protein L29 [Gammaproteobacteria bacterium]
MNINELRKQTAKELNGELVELRKEQFNLRMQAATGQLSNTARFKQIRKDIARLNTVLGEQSRAGS